MATHNPRRQRITADTPCVELAVRPTALMEPAARLTGAVLGATGLALLAVGLFGWSVAAARPEARLAPFGMGTVFTVLGAAMVYATHRFLLTSRHIEFLDRSLTSTERSLLRSRAWSLPYSAFRGVGIRRVLAPNRYGGGRVYDHVELVHEDARRTVRLLNAQAGRFSDAELERYRDDAAAHLGVPVLPTRAANGMPHA